MNIEQDSDIRVASIAKVRDDGIKSDEELEELEEMDSELLEDSEEAEDTSDSQE